MGHHDAWRLEDITRRCDYVVPEEVSALGLESRSVVSCLIEDLALYPA